MKTKYSLGLLLVGLKGEVVFYLAFYAKILLLEASIFTKTTKSGNHKSLNTLDYKTFNLI